MNGFVPKKIRNFPDITVVPILDMLVSVIFFLLLSTSFIKLTKLTVPPAAVSHLTATDTKIPTNPILFVRKEGDDLKLLLRWAGSQPGENSAIVFASEGNPEKTILTKAREIAKSYKQTYANDKTIQISLQKNLPYQLLISTMDGVREQFPDVVLASNAMADLLEKESGSAQ